ncbi:MAG: efflux transporter periplasmic adaptor subunit [Phenylobacterium sp. SCN 69-14]|nr:MAG: efflux transporter periplasmic adaptor subunit [Phenylobacterium sp. SCN 69-14]
MTKDKQRLFGAVAAAAVIAGGAGFGLSALLNRNDAPAAAKASESHGEEGEAGHAEDGKAGEAGHAEEGGHAEGGAEKDEEGVVALTPDQLQAAGIKIVAVGQGGGGETRLSGRVEPVIDARASVGAAVAGRIEQVLVAPGQSVRAGQPLIVLVSGDAATYRAAARRAYDRDRSLGEQGVVARQEVETSRAQAMSAEASARAARARSAAAGGPNASGRTSVTSPISGVVSSVAVGPGGFVAQGGIVAEVTNPARVELVFNAPPAIATGLRVGASIRVHGPAGEFDAVVTGVAAAANASTGATVVRARPSGGAAPPVGSPVTAAVVIGGATGGVTVPSEAVQTVEGGSVVFLQTAGGFRAVPVLTGRQAGGRTEILRGLNGSERIAGANAFLLKAELAKGQAEHGH